MPGDRLVTADDGQHPPPPPGPVGPRGTSRSTVDIIVSQDPTVRDLSLADFCADLTDNDKLHECHLLDAFRRTSDNLYERVRACFFLYAIHRFHLTHSHDPSCRTRMTGDTEDATTTAAGTSGTAPSNAKATAADHHGTIPYIGYKCLLDRQFERAIDLFLECPPSQAISSALGKAYYHLGFQILADQVRLSVKNHPGNAWMYAARLPFAGTGGGTTTSTTATRCVLEPGRILQERTPVRMDLSHCGWSDIFFLGMDFPEGAKVLNASIDLAVRGGPDGAVPVPPVECFLQVLDGDTDPSMAGKLRLTSVDLKAEVVLSYVHEVFDFCGDYLGLLRAGIVASGIVPLGLEEQAKGDNEDGPPAVPLSTLFDVTLGPGRGLHLTTRVRDIPKGSRLAVSTTLLSSIIALGMRATGQTQSMVGTLTEEERRLVAARSILGEWLGGSGGGWQDSGGVWPGIKLIEGVPATCPVNHPEYGVSRGRLLPQHRQLSDAEAPVELAQALQDHLVLVHGGMAQNVGPILEMVTEKYLLREADEWRARHDALGILDDILGAFAGNDIPRLAKLTTRNFFEPLQTIIPWASNLYTETLIERTRAAFGEDFLGFWMLGGASGGGMGFIFRPETKARAVVGLQEIMLATKRELEHALPFAMDPVVYEFKINSHGTMARWWTEAASAPTWRSAPDDGASTNADKGLANGSLENDNQESTTTAAPDLDDLLRELGFDREEHERIQHDYRTGRIGLRQNRLPMDTVLENATSDDVVLTDCAITPEMHERGMEELRKGTVGVVSLAAGVGSRWTQGAGCVKALHPFCKLEGRFRSFLEIHLAKSRRVSQLAGTHLPHVITTSHMTDSAIEAYLDRVERHGYEGPLYLSPGRSIGLRLVPTAADLDFSWQSKARLDEQAQKARESGHRALLGWARSCGEASDYRDNLPSQCLHPVGHFYEVPNLLLSGTLKTMLRDRAQLKYLMLHNIDTVGADVDPGILGLFVSDGTTLSFEVIPRKIEDVGGGLARVNGKTRLVEGLALPREEDEFKFNYYNTMTTWIDIDKLLHVFGLVRSDLEEDERKVTEAVHLFSRKLPTYVALKEVKKRWGNGQEDVYQTAQFEKLWSDMTAIDEVACGFYVVSRYRGSQLKDVAQLDGWVRDGSSSYLETLCAWS